ncbi:MAG: hypothetical protein U5M23_04315 [Marinagarivorans sp.]|nr:hypothetical protein [Marinagarivorans sp.]
MSITILSSIIEKSAQLAIANGNSISEISEGWTKVRQVVSMSKPLTSDLKTLIASEKGLRHWVSPATPHNRAEEGFTCDQDKVSISFPL